MAKVFSIFHFEFHPGVSATAFEQFVTEEVYPATVRPDLIIYVLKGDRGERNGKYLAIFEFESVEARNRYWPEEGVSAEAGRAFVAPWITKWGTLAQTTGTGATFTEYVVVGQ